MMARGVPTVAYLRREDVDRFVPFAKEIPVINANQETLYEVLSNLIEDSNLRHKLAEESKDYVRAHHDALKVVKKLAKVYSDL